MDLTAFFAAYGFNDRRQHLIGLLAAELDAIRAKGWQVRCYVFGSFVRDPLKEQPGDIDCLLGISKPFDDRRWYRQDATGEIHIKHNVLFASFATPNELRPCNTVGEMIALFNQGCALAGEETHIDGDGSDLIEVWL
ncbi:hypothetical protein IE4803_CH02944 [Rhizobium etli bv. phaseoli str. IE4803]|uniref:Nucleotidyltransferase domain-containing protein n=1 Tax=Rhizobium etli bv. mimosae str. IE4771 TaxID=1432050 RepID=A0A060I2Y9_RHIET|nr:hypothetical protein [Rhizobium sp. IE4771]AIC28069.1 hypothetical protein IE4771_CH02975 [Rhizobium sp. IE4771]AJC80128.1 hypothetical protein IE4803_CH02944 [Rhizobium etli bv. phaseoli str. IE4803]